MFNRVIRHNNTFCKKQTIEAGTKAEIYRINTFDDNNILTLELEWELSVVEKVATSGGSSAYAETPNWASAKGVAQLAPPEKRPPS